MGVQISESNTALGQIFETKKFLPEKIGKKSSKNGQKWHFRGLKGELTCVLQVTITLFYYKMVNSVMTLQFLGTKNNVLV